MPAASEPKSGSVVASAVIGGRSPASGRSQRSFCSSLPSSSTGSAKKPFEVIRLPMPEQPWESSSWTRQPVNASVSPPPPSSSGSMNDVSPIDAALCHVSSGTCGVGLVDLRGDGPDLARREVAADALYLLLLLGQFDHGRHRIFLLSISRCRMSDG